MKSRLVLLVTFLSMFMPATAVAETDFSRCKPSEGNSPYVRNQIEFAMNGDGNVQLPKECFRITRLILIQNPQRH